MIFHKDSTLEEILATARGREVIERHMPGILQDPSLVSREHLTLRRRLEWRFRITTQSTVEDIVKELNQPMQTRLTRACRPLSLDTIEACEFNAGPSPLTSHATRIRLAPMTRGALRLPATKPGLTLLDGVWQMACEGGETDRLGGKWSDAIPARVPGSVHAALVEAGRLPDPTFGRNQELAQKESYKTWWLKRTFVAPDTEDGPYTLAFQGICNVCTVWLNGRKLGAHEGMFGGPEFDVTPYLRHENTLIVRLAAIPIEGSPANNTSWQKTVVFNNVYGWHYSQLPSLGIWRSVELRAEPHVAIRHPFVSTRTPAAAGVVDLVVDLASQAAVWKGTLRGTVTPENFKGAAHEFVVPISSRKPERRLHLRFTIPGPQLWWPVDHGAPHLYRLTISFVPAGGMGADTATLCFGLRTVRMDPLPDGPRPEQYNWTFAINERPIFVKGSGWCTMDPLMDFSRARYDRFLSIAADQHCQLLRGWGSGMPETDDFYDLCDRKGIMLVQEWPTAWCSHETQPYDVMEETVRRNMLRLRSHPSLVMWGGGNETTRPYGKLIDMMGRYAVELDGSRPFHRTDPWGGSYHGYPSYWKREHLDAAIRIEAPFLGEFGMASMPVQESVRRYLPQDEQTRWPPKLNGALNFHVPTFNRDSLDRITQYADYFAPTESCGVARFIDATHLAQIVCLRHTLERARTRWPDCAGALYYKINDNFPAASWAIADWYGAIKPAHYFCQDAFAPLHACAIFERMTLAGAPANIPVYLLDDADTLAGAPWRVVARAVDGELKEIARSEFKGRDRIVAPLKLGALAMNWQQTSAAEPLFIVTEVRVRGRLADRTFYWLNFEHARGCLFDRPRTTLTLSVKRRRATVTNTGKVPALAVTVARPGHADTFMASDNCFWLDPGERRTVGVNASEGLTANGWNVS